MVIVQFATWLDRASSHDHDHSIGGRSRRDVA
jgi:hypothetical protein